MVYGRADGRRAHDGSMQHSGRRTLVRRIRMTLHMAAMSVRDDGLPSTVQSQDFAAWRCGEREMKFAAADELRVGDFFRGVGGERDRRVGGDELIDGQVKMVGGELEERFAGGGAGERRLA